MTKEVEIIKELRTKALGCSKNSYSPYSNAKIGSAVLADDGNIYLGTNVENSSFGATICAERVAIFSAIASGVTRIKKVYVYSKSGWPPCGICRQVMSEFADSNLQVIIGDESGKEVIMSFYELFPLAFTPTKYAEEV